MNNLIQIFFYFILNKFSYFLVNLIPITLFFCFNILGLNYLDEVPSNDPQAGPRYTCRLCHQTAHLTEMVRHLIGRKHRQKYMVKHYEHSQKPPVELFECLLYFLIYRAKTK